MGGFFPSKTLIMFPVLYVLLDNIYIGLIEKPFLVLPTLPSLNSYRLGTMYKVRYFYC